MPCRRDRSACCIEQHTDGEVKLQGQIWSLWHNACHLQLVLVIEASEGMLQPESVRRASGCDAMASHVEESQWQLDLCCCFACSTQGACQSSLLASRQSEDSHERRLAGGEDFGSSPSNNT